MATSDCLAVLLIYPPPPNATPGIFNAPVDAAALGLKDYDKIVPDPMDLGTVKSRLQVRALVVYLTHLCLSLSLITQPPIFNPVPITNSHTH